MQAIDEATIALGDGKDTSHQQGTGQHEPAPGQGSHRQAGSVEKIRGFDRCGHAISFTGSPGG